MNFIVKSLVSGFGLGYFPKAPGSAASLAGVFCFWFFGLQSRLHAAFLALGALLVAVMVAGRAERIFGASDDKRIVVDEIAGIFCCFPGLGLNGLEKAEQLVFLAAAFLFFRFFDILKVWPARRLERWPGAAGVLADDLLAAFYTNLLLRVMLRIW